MRGWSKIRIRCDRWAPLCDVSGKWWPRTGSRILDGRGFVRNPGFFLKQVFFSNCSSMYVEWFAAGKVVRDSGLSVPFFALANSVFS